MILSKDNLQLLARATEFYEKAGFKPIEVPWEVNSDIDELTRPRGKKPIKTPRKKCLIGSGEQGFLQLIEKGSLVSGLYQTITPCWRDEVPTDLNRTSFVKLELISIPRAVDGRPQLDALDIAQLAQEFFDSEGVRAKIKAMNFGNFDLVCKTSGIELGSYCNQEVAFAFFHHHNTYTCGTGIALPRFNVAYEKQLELDT